MIIIDELAEQRLTEALGTNKNDEGLVRCVYLMFSGLSGGLSSHRELVLGSISKTISATDKRVFICEDGDMFVLGTAITSKEMKQLTLDVIKAIPSEKIEPLITIYEVSLHASKIYHAIDKKLDAKRKKKEVESKESQRALVEKRREAILSLPKGDHLQQQISAKRKSRKDIEIMIIEDDAFSRKLVENVLQKAYKLTQLGSAETALDTYTEVAPNIVFLDINLPDVTGHELLKKILILDPHAYIVMFSGNNDAENVTAAIKQGARGFVAKPFNREKLLEYVTRYTKQAVVH